MLRHYFVSEDLNEIAHVEKELTENGLSAPQIHVLSDNDAEVKNHNLNEVEAVLKKDVVRSTEIGALVGVFLSALSLLVAYSMGWTETQAGWIPFVFLAIVILGFCTWEGGFIGIQRNNVKFEKFQGLLKKGKHILLVDVPPSQEATVSRVIHGHPELKIAGFGEATPLWFIKSQESFKRFVKFMP